MRNTEQIEERYGGGGERYTTMAHRRSSGGIGAASRGEAVRRLTTPFGSDRRRSRTLRGRCGGLVGPLLVLVSLGACGGEAGRTLSVVETVRLQDPLARTLAVDSGGRYWLGEPGRMRLRGGAGEQIELELPGREAPRVVGWTGGRAYLQAGDSIFVVAPDSASVRARRGGFGNNPVVIDVRGRLLFQGARSGSVLAHDPTSLEPRLAWAALGAPTAAIALSPLGDRLYQVLGGEEERARVLIRDLQTGRVLGTAHVSAAFDRMAADRRGVLYGVVREGRRAVVVALQPLGSELQLLWRRNLTIAEGSGEVRLAVAEGRVAVWGLGGGVRLLDAEEGTELGRTRTEPLDVAFSGDDLWTLHPGELRRVE